MPHAHSGYRPRSAAVLKRSASAAKSGGRGGALESGAHMYLSMGALPAEQGGHNLAMNTRAPDAQWTAQRAQLQEAASMMWTEIGAPWMYLEKAEEVVGLLLENGALQPAERQLLLRQRALLAGAHAHLAN